MDEETRKKYLEAYYENEYSANKQMAYSCAFVALAILVFGILFNVNVFVISDNTLLLLNIVNPIAIVILLSTLVHVRLKLARHPSYKYFIMITFVLVIGLMNIALPKHAIIGWTLAIVMANHYYNPKMGRVLFAITLILMLVCIIGGMLIGEFDQNLFDAELDSKTNLIYSRYEPTMSWENTVQGRIQFLDYIRDVHGSNRYLSGLVFYYLPRATLVTLVFLISNALNMRTYKLLVDEIKVNTEQEKVSSELQIAQTIQLSTLPSEFVEKEDIEVLGELKAAKEVGGDFYDYFRIDKTHILFTIGDVSGKGVPAAMFMMKTLTCIENSAKQLGRSPAQILQDVNSSIYKGNGNQMFATVFLGILDVETGVFKFANAGHNPPVIGLKGNYELLKCNAGFILGAMEETFVKDEEIVLQKGQSLTLYTDGVTEARNKKGEFYGEKRLLELFNKKKISCLPQIHQDLKDDITGFVDGAIQSDDITYLSFIYKGNKTDIKEVTLEANKDAIPALLKDIEEFANKHKFDSKFANSLLIVGDELISNIVKYGYKDMNGDIFMRLLYDIDDKEFALTLIDKGVRFDPFLMDNKPLEGSAEDHKEGGLGILIVKKVMDEVFYDYTNGKNIIVLKKKL